MDKTSRPSDGSKIGRWYNAGMTKGNDSDRHSCESIAKTIRCLLRRVEDVNYIPYPKELRWYGSLRPPATPTPGYELTPPKAAAKPPWDAKPWLWLELPWRI